MKLKDWLKKHKVKVTQLARIAEIGHVTLYRYLNGTQKMTPLNAATIERATNGAVSRLEILFESEFYSEEVETLEGVIRVIRCRDTRLESNIAKSLNVEGDQNRRVKERERVKVTEEAPKDSLESWCFTFGVSDEILSKSYVRIFGTYKEARAIIVARFASKWAFQYEYGEEFLSKVLEYGLREI